MLKVVLFALFVAADGVTLRARLPTYIGQCSLSDPEFQRCYIKNANKAIPIIAKGDYHYNIPYMKPLKLTHVVIRDDPDLRFVLRNLEVYGLENTKLDDAFYDHQSGVWRHNLTNPHLTILADYVMTGNLLNNYVHGGGRTNITIINARFDSGGSFIVDQELYGTITESYTKYTPGLVIYDFTNINSGNDFLGYQTNIFINNNWRDVSRTFRPGAEKAINDFLISIYQSFANLVPLNEIFIN